MKIGKLRIPLEQPQRFGRVAVLHGGSSAEREVSLASGSNVLAGLQTLGVDAQPVDGLPALAEALRQGCVDRVFNVLHGQHGGGEDGILQGWLEAAGMPYTGSKVLGSALSMDKLRSKQVWLGLGLPTPRHVALPRGVEVAAAAAQIGYPLIVKPACEGSSVGISRIFEAAELAAAVALAERYPGDLLMETLIEGGGEFTVGILDGQALPSIRIVPAGEYYDYHAKYQAEDTQYRCGTLDDETESQLGELALTAFRALGCESWGRVDLMRDATGQFWLLEVNTAPGMTSHSLVPKAAAALGIDFPELCWRILETSLGERE